MMRWFTPITTCTWVHFLQSLQLGLEYDWVTFADFSLIVVFTLWLNIIKYQLSNIHQSSAGLWTSCRVSHHPLSKRHVFGKKPTKTRGDSNPGPYCCDVMVQCEDLFSMPPVWAQMFESICSWRSKKTITYPVYFITSLLSMWTTQLEVITCPTAAISTTIVPTVPLTCTTGRHRLHTCLDKRLASLLVLRQSRSVQRVGEAN